MTTQQGTERAHRACESIWCHLLVVIAMLRYSATARLLSTFVVSTILVMLCFEFFIFAGTFSEHDLVLVLVWSLFVSLGALAAGDFAAWWMIRDAENRDQLGYILQQQYLSLFLRHTVMIGFHFILAYVVTFDHYPLGPVARVSLYTSVLVASSIACWYSIRMARWAQQHRRPR